MTPSQIRFGAFYLWTNGIFVRQVIAFNDTDIQYRDFMFETGEPLQLHAVCSLKHFCKGAIRELSIDEALKMQTDKSTKQYYKQETTLIDLALREATIEQLLVEIERRK